jgi:hypothetical protein
MIQTLLRRKGSQYTKLGRFVLGVLVANTAAGRELEYIPRSVRQVINLYTCICVTDETGSTSCYIYTHSIGTVMC